MKGSVIGAVWWRRWMLSGAMALTVLVTSMPEVSSSPDEEPCYFGFGSFRSLPGDSGPAERLIQVWTCPEPFKVAWQTAVYFEGVYSAFNFMNGRNPTTWEELSGHPYMVVPIESLWNAYENRPVRVIQQDPPCPDNASISPGDIMVGHRTGGAELVVNVGVVLPSPPFPEDDRMCLATNPATNAEELVDQWFDIYDTEDPTATVGTFRFDEREWMNTATAEEKTLAALARIVREVADLSHHLWKRHPVDWQDFKDMFYWASAIRNPYTGQPIQDVSTLSPSAGDCTYNPDDIDTPYYIPEIGRSFIPPREQLIRDAEYTTWPQFVTMYCYNDRLEPVSRWKYELQFHRVQNLLAEEVLGPGAYYHYLK